MKDTFGIGKNIRSARNENRMTQRQLAEKSGISQTMISDYENGNKTPGLFSLARIAKPLNKSMDELFYGNSNISFITSAPDKGAVIANSLVALWEQGAIDTHATIYETEASDNEVILGRYSFATRRLIENLYEFETKRDTYSNPQEYLESVKDSIANEINAYS